MDFGTILEIFQNVFIADFARYFITAGLFYLVFWVVFKRQWKHRVIQKKALRFDKMSSEFAYSMSTIVIFAIIGTFIYLWTKWGYTTIYNDISDYGYAWLFGSFVVMLLIHDTYFYWGHRLMHHPLLFKHVHLVHHKSTNPSPWAAYSFHPLEAVFEASVYLVFIFTIPVHPITLFAFLIFMITRNVVSHLGIEILPKWFIRNKWINWQVTTTHHDLHHKKSNVNYGIYFTFWDKWCGTEDQQYAEIFEEVTSRSKEDIFAQPERKSNKTVTENNDAKNPEVLH